MPICICNGLMWGHAGITPFGTHPQLEHVCYCTAANTQVGKVLALTPCLPELNKAMVDIGIIGEHDLIPWNLDSGFFDDCLPEVLNHSPLVSSRPQSDVEGQTRFSRYDHIRKIKEINRNRNKDFKTASKFLTYHQSLRRYIGPIQSKAKPGACLMQEPDSSK